MIIQSHKEPTKSTGVRIALQEQLSPSQSRGAHLSRLRMDVHLWAPICDSGSSCDPLTLKTLDTSLSVAEKAGLWTGTAQTQNVWPRTDPAVAIPSSGVLGARSPSPTAGGGCVWSGLLLPARSQQLISCPTARGSPEEAKLDLLAELDHLSLWLQFT